MSRNLVRLRKGERWWTAEVFLRSLGLLLLTACYRLGLIAHRLVTTPSPHPATSSEFAVCLAAVACLSSGLAFALFGPGLFRQVPIPQKNTLYWKP